MLVKLVRKNRLAPVFTTPAADNLQLPVAAGCRVRRQLLLGHTDSLIM